MHGKVPDLEGCRLCSRYVGMEKLLNGKINVIEIQASACFSAGILMSNEEDVVSH